MVVMSEEEISQYWERMELATSMVEMRQIGKEMDEHYQRLIHQAGQESITMEQPTTSASWIPITQTEKTKAG